MTDPRAVRTADELYGLVPEDFVAVRDERVREARDDGDRELAAELRGLRRPTTAAWLANLLVRSDREQVEALLELGDALRDAEARLSGEELRALTAQRRAVVSSLVTEARRAARSAGRPVTEGVGWDLEATLTVALTDERARGALLTGRLTSAARHGAGDATDVQAALPEEGPEQPDETSTDDLAHRRDRRRQEELDAARRRREEAEEAAAEAAAELSAARERVGEARVEERTAERSVRAAAAEVAELERRLAEARDAVDVAERALADARAARVEADAEAATAAETAAAARAALDAARRAEAGPSRLP